MKTLLALLTIACTMVVLGAAEKKILLVQVAHRHGARTPLVSVNDTIICGTAGCGQLNKQGKNMLTQVGAWARQRYIENIDPNIGFMSSLNEYSPNYVASRSTNIARTLQSADGFIRGLYPNLTDFFPVISTVSFWEDTLLLVDALPAFHLPATIDRTTLYETVAPYVLNKISKADLQRMGRELSLDGVCDVPNFYVTNCALQAQDVVAAYYSTGQITAYPFSATLRIQLNDIREYWNSFLFPYHKSDPVDKAHGSFGQNLAQEMIQSMLDKINNTQMLPFFLKEYSAHDTTVMPLCTTLGQNGMMLPLFGQSYFLELLEDTAANASPKHFVRGWYGAPEQGVGPNTFTPSPFPLTCMRADGSTYNTTDDCPLEEFIRFVDSSKAENPEGLCYVTPSTLQKVDCADPRNSSTPSDSLCQFYRDHCPGTACGDHHYLNQTDLTCNALFVQEAGVGRGTTALIAIVSAAAGALIGAVIMKLFASRANRGNGDYKDLA